jgi:hypothetical protein
MTLQWAAANLLTGKVTADLPSLDPGWPLRNTISAADTATAVLHLAGAPENWETATLPGGALIFGFDDRVMPDGSQPKPIIWCGYVTSRPRDAASDDVTLAVATFEAVLDRAYVGDVTYTTSQHRDDIIADLVTTWFGPSTGITYLQLAYTPGGGPTPSLMDSPPTAGAAIIMQKADAATVKTRIDQVVGQLGGEYGVTWAWSTDGESIIPTLRFGDRIGSTPPAGLDPDVTFELPGTITSFTVDGDFSLGAGANQVVTYSSGQGATTPFSSPVTATGDGRPTLAYWYQPAPSLSPAALQQYAAQALTVLAQGKQSVAFSYSTTRDTGRTLGLDWNLGDTIGYRVPGQYTNEAGQTITVLAFPGGVDSQGRVIAYELTDPTTITPVLADSAIYQGN